MSRLAVSWHTLDVAPAFNLKQPAQAEAHQIQADAARKSRNVQQAQVNAANVSRRIVKAVISILYDVRGTKHN